MNNEQLVELLIKEKIITRTKRLKKCSEEKLNKNEYLTDLIMKCTSFLDEKFSLTIRLHTIIDNITNTPCCQTCGTVIHETTRENKFKKFCNMTCKGKYPEELHKIQETCLYRYGVKNVYQRAHNRDKANHTYQNNFEGGHPLKDPNVQAKRIATVIDKYGVDNIMKDPLIFSKSRRYQNKLLTLPSGQVRIYQGFENVALLKLLDIYSEDEIISERQYLPIIKYNTKRYFPDIFIPKDNLIIEVKSSWTYKQHFDKNQLKRQAALDAGYRFQFWICSRTLVTDII